MEDNSLERAIGLVQAGRMEAARQQLEQILKNDRSNISAWHWYAQTWPGTKEKIRIWQACLRFNPASQQAQQALKDLGVDSRNLTGQEIKRPIYPSPKKSSGPSPWLIIGTIGVLAIFAWVAVNNFIPPAPKDPEPYRHIQPVEYYLYVPKAYSADQEWPLFIGFHGFGGTIADCWELWQPYAEREDFILLCPTLANAEDGWYPETAKSVVWDIIGQVKKEYRVKQRMFIAGYFAGAHFVQEFAYNYPQSVSGASILSAASYDKANLSGKHIFFLVVSGDQIDPFSVEQSSLFSQYLAQEGFDVQYKLVPGVGHVITKEGRNLTIKLFRETIEQ
jgi:hypothetical protein